MHLDRFSFAAGNDLHTVHVPDPRFHGLAARKPSRVVADVPEVPLLEKLGMGTIFHIDMDAFFASVEILDRPELKDVPMFVAGRGPRSVVTSANYPARAFGVRSAMPVAQALRKCPHAIAVEPHFEKYRHYSALFGAVLAEVTPIVEKVSIDEAFIDVSSAVRRLGSPLAIAMELRAAIFESTGLSASIGVAPSKFVAKIASTGIKPEGLLVIPRSEQVAYVQSLPVRALWGVGAKTAERLERFGILSVADLAHIPVSQLVKSLGATGEHLHHLAWARDPRPVTSARVDKSIGAEETFATDIDDVGELERELLRLSVKVGSRARAAGFQGSRVSIKVRYSDFSTITRNTTLTEASDRTQDIFERSRSLLRRLEPFPAPIRLIGVRLEALRERAGSFEQLSIDPHDDAWKHVDQVSDDIADKFGGIGVVPARLLKSPKSGSGAHAENGKADG